jgi:hypothetical protein
MRFAVAMLIFDTGWVTAALMGSGRFNADFYMLYFFILLLAAIGENLRLIAIGACVVCAVYLFGHFAHGTGWEAWTSRRWSAFRSCSRPRCSTATSSSVRATRAGAR